MVQETGALVQVRDGEDRNWSRECPKGKQIMRLRTISETKMPGLG